MATKVVIYNDSKAMKSGVSWMARFGWHVVSVTTEQRSQGCFRFIFWGLLALLLKPKTSFVVTYMKTD